MTDQTQPVPPAGEFPPRGAMDTWGALEARDIHRKLDRYYNELAQGMERLDERAEARWRRQRALINGVGLVLVAAAIAPPTLGRSDSVAYVILGIVLVLGGGWQIWKGLGEPYDRVSQTLPERASAEPAERSTPSSSAETLLGVVSRRQRGTALDKVTSDRNDARNHGSEETN